MKKTFGAVILAAAGYALKNKLENMNPDYQYKNLTRIHIKDTSKDLPNLNNKRINQNIKKILIEKGQDEKKRLFDEPLRKKLIEILKDNYADSFGRNTKILKNIENRFINYIENSLSLLLADSLAYLLITKIPSDKTIDEANLQSCLQNWKNILFHLANRIIEQVVYKEFMKVKMMGVLAHPRWLLS